MRTLTDEERQKITDNYDLIRKKLARYSARICNMFKQMDRDEVVDSAIGYIVVATMEYDGDKAKEDWITFVCKRAILRFLDEARYGMDASRTTHQKQKFLARVREEIVKENGFCEEADIYTALQGYEDKRVKSLLEAESVHVVRGDDALMSIIDHGVSSEAEWKMTQQDILKRVDERFPEGSRLNDIARSLIVDNVLPKCNNEQHKTFSQIAEASGVNQSRVSQIFNSKVIEEFFVECGLGGR